jgi:geranylgeranyl diphosphate synthase, type III
MLNCDAAFLVSIDLCKLGYIHNAHVVAHKIYGIPQTINSANYVYFLAYKELFALRALGDSRSRLDEIVNGEK